MWETITYKKDPPIQVTLEIIGAKENLIMI